MKHSFLNLYTHIIWGTKNRLPMINQNWEQNLYNYIGEIVSSENDILIQIGGIENHVHTLIKPSGQRTIPQLVKDIKGTSSRHINQTQQLDYKFAWQEGYSAFSVSYSLVKTVDRYIQRQKEHHNKQTFEEEYLELLSKNDIQCNPKAIFAYGQAVQSSANKPKRTRFPEPRISMRGPK